MTILSERCNGWTNYATWRVNLELIDGINPHDMGWLGEDVPDLTETLKEYVNELLDETTPEGIALDYARAFISYVNWGEIAEFMLDSYANQEA